MLRPFRVQRTGGPTDRGCGIKFPAYWGIPRRNGSAMGVFKMEGNIARWLQIKRFTREEVETIHQAEKRWYHGSLINKPKDWNAHDWKSKGAAVLFLEGNERYGPFWERSKTEPERNDEVRSFERKIWPLWAPCLRNIDVAEIDSMHKADWAIWERSPAINYGPGVTTGDDRSQYARGDQ